MLLVGRSGLMGWSRLTGDSPVGGFSLFWVEKVPRNVIYLSITLSID